MANVTLQGKLIHTAGNLPDKGSFAPAFTLTKTDLSDIALNDLKGSVVILNIFPSLDTPTCALSVKRFNSEANKIDNANILCVSMDLPFAQKRFCAAEGLDKVIPVSAFRFPEFGDTYGVRIIEGKLAGLFSRAVVVIDVSGKVIYTEQVNEISEEPNYDAVLAILK